MTDIRYTEPSLAILLIQMMVPTVTTTPLDIILPALLSYPLALLDSYSQIWRYIVVGNFNPPAPTTHSSLFISFQSNLFNLVAVLLE